jgi:DNA-binding transcriptional LysR family regulator
VLEGVTLEQLRTLLAVVSGGSFTAAARKLGRVQAAVSQSIDRLEAQLGLRLFDRSGRVPRLTLHGEAVVAAAGPILGDVNALRELVLTLKSGAETTLRIVVDALFPTDSLIVFAKEFEQRHPSVELVIFTDVLSAVTAHVREKQSTWGVAIEDAEMKDLERRVIAEVQLVAVASPEHALGRRQGPIADADVQDSVQIVLGEHRREAQRGSDDHGVLSRRRWRVVDLATKHALIANGLGWGHMPEHVVRADLQAGRLVALSLVAWGGVPLRRALVVVRRQDVAMGPVAKWAQGRLGELCRRSVDGRGAGEPSHHEK